MSGNQFVEVRKTIAEGGLTEAITVSRNRLPTRILKDLAEHYGISCPAAYRLIGMGSATVARKIRNEELLTAEASERLVRIAQLEAEAIEVLGSEEVAQEWLCTPSIILNGERPIEMIDTGFGSRIVLKVLADIRYGGVV